MAAMLVWLAGQPLATPDLWFHLKAGETFWTEGLWPETDPMLFTAFDRGPVQHEWLFGVGLHLIQKAAGFQGLRAAHVLFVLFAILVAALLLKNVARRTSYVPAGICVFIVLSWQRLFQLRPDLISIPATFLIYYWLIRPVDGPSWRGAGAAVVFTVFWANTHSLSSIALAVTAAALLGALFQWRFERSLETAGGSGMEKARRRVVGLAACLAAMTLVSLIHPRGIDQLLTFFISSSETAVWAIQDEWHAFHPFFPSPPHNSPSLPWLTWLTANLVIAGFVTAAAVRIRNYHRRPSVESLDRLEPVLFMVGVASMGAMLISIRFLWMGIFPLLYVVRNLRSRPNAGLAGLAPVAVSVALLFFFSGPGRWKLYAADTPAGFREYLGTPVKRRLFTYEGMRFLKESGVKGRLFNPYMLGAYLGYHLSPDIRTFIDGRTEHYPIERAVEYQIITRGRAMADGRSPQHLLDAHRVDFFYAVGGPGYDYAIDDTWGRLDGVPGWVPVFRSLGLVVYMRQVPRNELNGRRIADYYGRFGIPFDPGRGIDTADILEARPDWAVSHRLVPPLYADLKREAGEAGKGRGAAALELASILYQAGEYRGALRYGRQAAKEAGQVRGGAAVAARSLLRLGEFDEALSFIDEIEVKHGGDRVLETLEVEVRAYVAQVTGEGRSSPLKKP